MDLAIGIRTFGSTESMDEKKNRRLDELVDSKPDEFFLERGNRIEGTFCIDNVDRTR